MAGRHSRNPEHLERCVECRAALNRERQYLERLRDAAVPEASHDLTQRLLQNTRRLADESAPDSRGPEQPAAPVIDQAGFEGWKQGVLARHGGVRRAEYERELAGLTPDPSVIRLDRNQPEFSRPAGAYVQNAVTATRIAQARQRTDRVPWAVVRGRLGGSAMTAACLNALARPGL